jgi:hypothetical protein
MTIVDIHQSACVIAKLCFEENNPLPLQMYFQEISPEEIRDLLNWTDDDTIWKPKTYPEDRSHFRLLAECMLRYYYYAFEPKEEDEENEECQMTPEFLERKEYWSAISIDGCIRPRLFSRDVLKKKKRKTKKSSAKVVCIDSQEN